MTYSIRVVFLTAALALAVPAVHAQQIPFEDVVRNLRNPDPKVRLSALQLLREAQHLEAIKPVAALVNDTVEEIQLEALATELSFYLVEDAPAKRKVGFVVEVRSKAVRSNCSSRARWSPGPVEFHTSSWTRRSRRSTTKVAE